MEREKAVKAPRQKTDPQRVGLFSALPFFEALAKQSNLDFSGGNRAKIINCVFLIISTTRED